MIPNLLKKKNMIPKCTEIIPRIKDAPIIPSNIESMTRLRDIEATNKTIKYIETI